MKESELIMKWALENYAKGGHWIVETMSLADIDETFRTVREAQEYCGLIEDCKNDCRE
jgi:hypothetical protein